MNDVSSSFVPLRCFVSFLCSDQNILVWAEKGALRTELAYKTDGISWVSISSYNFSFCEIVSTVVEFHVVRGL